MVICQLSGLKGIPKDSYTDGSEWKDGDNEQYANEHIQGYNSALNAVSDLLKDNLNK